MSSRQALLPLVLLLAACASSAVVVGQRRPPISPDQVTIYVDAPAGFEKVAVLQASSDNSLAITSQGRTNKVIERLKAEAAKLGANGVLLQSIGEQHPVTVTAGQIDTGTIATGSAIAIYVPSAKP